MAAVTQTTKGLLLICTLLSLVSFINSLSHKEQLAKVKESHQQTKEQLQKMKINRISTIDTSSDMMRDYINMLDYLIELERRYPGALSDDMPLEPLLKQSKEIVKKAKALADIANDSLGKELRALEEIIKQNEMKMNCLEEQ